MSREWGRLSKTALLIIAGVNSLDKLAKPILHAAMTSLWPPKIERVCVASDRLTIYPLEQIYI
ncbi:hypothetical protein [Nostoc sp. DedSLP04]|uniref:hypothetical protein n=1 Tax=Nostoc sp. DedSLP04 TaxID=3075401 RepID=UPI002AD54FF4|nr:hypothetical protein [Nostoc sp. DedSLP04]MDZ8035710.1 hypothetical protein [Nostoc sp. DedSLP04]